MADRASKVNVVELVAEHHAVLFRYAVRLSGSVPDAEDLTQQTFLIAQAKLDQLRDPSNARSWLFAILRSCFLGSCRRRVPVPAANLEMKLDEVVQAAGADDEIDRERLESALGELPEEFRLVLVMFYFEDCSYREIATKLNLPPGTVMSRLSRAKKHLRQRLFARPCRESDTGGPHKPSVSTPRNRYKKATHRDDR